MARKYSRFILFLFLLACSKPAEDSVIDDDVVITEDEELKNKYLPQNRWTYKQMREDYLWEEYLPDTSSMSLTASPQSFFSRLLYAGDRFSWIERNQDFRGASMYDRFGLEAPAYLTSAGEKVRRVALVLPRSPAQKAGLHRGDWFRIIDDAAEMMEIETGRVSGTAFIASNRLSLSAAAQEYTDAVALDSVYRMEGKTTGYLFYNSFQDETNSLSNPYREELRRIFSRFREQDITDLVVDLRYNPGGYVSICQFLGSLILPDEFQGTIAGFHSYNKRRAAILLKETGSEEDILYFPAKDAVGEDNVGLRKVYFIITGCSASASESLINSLEPCIGVVTIGSTSTGKNVGSHTCKDNQYEWQLQPITFYYYNRNHQMVPETGLTPDIPVDESTIGTLYELGDVRERLLSVALGEITGSGTMRSAIDYGELLLAPVDEDLPRRKTEGLIQFTMNN